MNTRTAPSASSRAFTLLELLAVVAIISVLMGMLFPSLFMARETARKATALQTTKTVTAAVNAYFSEYGKLPDLGAPAGTPGANPDVVVGEPGAGALLPNGALFDVLRALDRGANAGHKQNPRRVSYFQEKAVANPDSPKDGFLDRVGTGAGANPANLGSLFDPWGHQYNIILDSNYDTALQLDEQYIDFAGAPPDGQRPLYQAGAFSLGKDGMLGTRNNRVFHDSDDVASWR